MSKLMQSLLAGAFAVVVAACSQQGPEAEQPAAPASTGPTIGLAVSPQSNPFFVSLKSGAEAEARALGMTLITVDAQDDPARQISSIEDLIQKKVKVILVNPTDSAAVASAVKEANAAGIPVITLDRAVDGGTVASHVARWPASTCWKKSAAMARWSSWKAFRAPAPHANAGRASIR